MWERVVQVFRYERDGLGWHRGLYPACATLWDMEWKGQQKRVRGVGKELIAVRKGELKGEGTGRVVFEGCN